MFLLVIPEMFSGGVSSTGQFNLQAFGTWQVSLYCFWCGVVLTVTLNQDCRLTLAFLSTHLWKGFKEPATHNFSILKEHHWWRPDLTSQNRSNFPGGSWKRWGSADFRRAPAQPSVSALPGTNWTGPSAGWCDGSRSVRRHCGHPWREDIAGPPSHLS